MSEKRLKVEVDKALEYLKQGKTILYPTDTVWGVGCDATNAKAVKNIYSLKRRNEAKSLIILVDSIEMLKKYIAKQPDSIYQLADTLDNPTTIIYPRAKNLANNAIANDGSIAIRIVKEEFCKQLIKKFGKPITSSSANISGDKTPLLFRKILPDVIKKVDHIVDWNRDEISDIKPSTIIRANEDGSFEIIRE
ncbi:MAG: L-threonylcarbamoyladenylate synthase [Bacteroidota bacterium]|nr:L-threonylcarbamoyladenylate synthase [Bacteroidota bacterium]